jgi:hypothetical protein
MRTQHSGDGTIGSAFGRRPSLVRLSWYRRRGGRINGGRINGGRINGCRINGFRGA